MPTWTQFLAQDTAYCPLKLLKFSLTLFRWAYTSAHLLKLLLFVQRNVLDNSSRHERNNLNSVYASSIQIIVSRDYYQGVVYVLV